MEEVNVAGGKKPRRKWHFYCALSYAKFFANPWSSSGLPSALWTQKQSNYRHSPYYPPCLQERSEASLWCRARTFCAWLWVSLILRAFLKALFLRFTSDFMVHWEIAVVFLFFLSSVHTRDKHTTWLEFACPVNQRPKSTMKEKKPTNLCATCEFLKKCVCHLIIRKSCHFDFRINKPFACSRCVICVSCSVHVISTYYAHKGSWAFFW